MQLSEFKQKQWQSMGFDVLNTVEVEPRLTIEGKIYSDFELGINAFYTFYMFVVLVLEIE